GLRWGMLTSRLALGLLPLLVLSLRPWLDDGRRPVWTPIVAAGALLAHPAAAPAVAAILGAAGLLVGLLRPGRPTLRRLVALRLLAVGVTLFWTGPLLVRRAWVVPLAWGEATLAGFAADIGARPLLLVLIVAAPLAWGA